jgi:hypothetical protein
VSIVGELKSIREETIDYREIVKSDQLVCKGSKV